MRNSLGLKRVIFEDSERIPKLAITGWETTRFVDSGIPICEIAPSALKVSRSSVGGTPVKA